MAERRRLDRNSFSGSGPWRITIDSKPATDERLLLVLSYPFKAEIRVADPLTGTTLRFTKTGPDRDPGWPARWAVIPLGLSVPAGTSIELCLKENFGKPVELELVTESALRARMHDQTFWHGVVLGSLLALALAGIGMTAALRNTTFLLLSFGLIGALLYLTATRGSIYEIPLLAQAAEIWTVHRLGGNLAVLTLGIGLARLIDLPTRRPQIWALLRAILLLVVILLGLMLIPGIGMMKSTATAGNLTLLAVIGLLFGTSTFDAWRGHQPSRVLLLAWSPPFLIAGWTALRVLFGEDAGALVESLLPLALAFSSAVLFYALALEISSFRAQRDHAQTLADRDDLTGVLGRTAFDRILVSAHQQALSSNNRPLAILFADVDHFKHVNDEYGHQVGDRILVALVHEIEQCLRSGDVLARYGGEEFLVLLEDVGDEQASTIAERIRVRVENGGKPIAPDLPPITLSIGVALLDRDRDEQIRGLIERADSALRECKKSGRNRILLASPPNPVTDC